MRAGQPGRRLGRRQLTPLDLVKEGIEFVHLNLAQLQLVEQELTNRFAVSGGLFQTGQDRIRIDRENPGHLLDVLTFGQRSDHLADGGDRQLATIEDRIEALAEIFVAPDTMELPPPTIVGVSIRLKIASA